MLDFDTNGDIDNPAKPLSHAALVKRYIEKKYPELATLTFNEVEMQNFLNQKNVKSRAKQPTAVKSKRTPAAKAASKKKASDDSQLSIL